MKIDKIKQLVKGVVFSGLVMVTAANAQDADTPKKPEKTDKKVETTKKTEKDKKVSQRERYDALVKSVTGTVVQMMIGEPDWYEASSLANRAKRLTDEVEAEKLYKLAADKLQGFINNSKMVKKGDTLTMGKVSLNLTKKVISFPATLIKQDQMPLETIICRKHGRVHETLLISEAKPIHLQTLLEGMGATNGALDNTQKDKQGDLVQVNIVYTNKNKRTVHKHIEDFFDFDSKPAHVKFPTGRIVYVGSSVGKRQYRAESSGELIKVDLRAADYRKSDTILAINYKAINEGKDSISQKLPDDIGEGDSFEVEVQIRLIKHMNAMREEKVSLDSFRINGGNKVSGTITASGNKNAALPMIAATLLTDQVVTLNNVPDIVDVNVMIEALTILGANCTFVDNCLTVDSSNLNSYSLSHDLCRKIRTSVLLVAPLLYRFGKASIYPPGGDVIGRRRLDAHIYGLTTMGTKFETIDTKFEFSITDGFKGHDLFFDEASVTATEHILMAAVVAEGVTYIRNAASEPHVQNLAEMLSSMGANIEGLNTNTLKITGVKSLNGTTHRIVSDHIEVGSFLALAAVTGGTITIEGVRPSHYWMIRRVFDRFNIPLTFTENSVSIVEPADLRVKNDVGESIPRIDDGPWPQFPSDLMSSMLIVATQAKGTVLFFEKMFESRMYFVDWLIGMGASVIVCDPHRVVVSGKSDLIGSVVSSPDIRAGMALLTAAIAAKGESIIRNAQVIDRGYEKLENKLQALGVDIVRERG